jgi:hypothetical protein
MARLAKEQIAATAQSSIYAPEASAARRLAALQEHQINPSDQPFPKPPA